MPTKWEDITDMFTPKGVAALCAGETIELGEGNIVKVGAVLKFQQPLSQAFTSLRITRVDKRTGKIWAVKTEMITTEEAMELERQSHGRATRRLKRRGNLF